MTAPNPSRSPRPWRPAWFILAFFTLLSLAANAFLLWLLWTGWQLYEEEAVPRLEDAAAMGRALQAAAQEPLTMEFAIDEELPIQLDVPIDHAVEVTLDDTVTVSRTYLIEWTLPVVGPVSKTFPLRFDVPIHIETTVPVSLTVPVSDVVPVDLTIPVSIDLMEHPIGADLIQLGQVLEGLAPPARP